MEGKRKRNRAKQTTSLQERLISSAEEARARARHLSPGAEREKLLRKARQAARAAELDEVLSLGPSK
ncbi:hypothetical protein CWO90_19930 [Bradyrhizobium sp. Leo121]|nr:hypothetical protein [Bradyrhizobium sp. Leo121]RZN30542.1 hypothetical protein CWO90_19930 [Bradyrhizobium sp. Leo121]